MTRLRLTLVWCPCVLATAAILTPAAAQEPEPRYQSRFVEANGIRLQYMDFGGSGLPLIFVQDIHNYFEDEEPFFRDLWSAFYVRFTGDHRVLATVKRGYGESDDPGWGYDVATHSEDLLGLMDALGIRRAVLVGRVPATQDLTWIAEHHPERVAGLVYLGNPVVLQPSQHPEARLFSENYTRGACDLQERGIALAGARGPWRPHFLDDETARIDVPSLRFTHPVYDRRSMDRQRLDRLDAIAAAEPRCPGHAQSLEYFRALAADPERRAALRAALEASDPSVPIDEGIERAFGTRMRTVVEPDLEGGWAPLHDFFEPHIRRFLEETSPALSAGSEGMLETDSAIIGVIHEVYRTISGPPGESRDWEALRRLFAPGARLTAMVTGLPPDSMHGGSRPTTITMSVQDYIDLAGPHIVRAGLFEEELHHEIHRYGDIAHVFSSYVIREGAPDSEPVDHGINSLQLVYGEGRWWIHSVLWDYARRGAGPLTGAWGGGAK